MSDQIRAVWYARVSTESQIDNTSLSEQETVCTAAISQRGWLCVGSYVDEGLSGTKATRPQWQRMLAGIRAGEVDAVIVSKLDRFARNAGHAITETDALVALGVQFVSVKESIDLSTAHGRMMRTMLAGFAELERDTIVARTVSGQRAKAATGEWPGGQPPYGWRLEGRKRTAHPVPDDSERAIIRRVYNLFVTEALNCYEVAERLAVEGLLARGGGNWRHDRVRATFRNPVLWTGVRVWGSPDGRRKGRHTRVDTKGRPIYGDPIQTRLPDPPLTQEEFDVIQRVIDRTKPTWTPAPAAIHPLGGRLFGACGKAYRGVQLQGRADTYRCTGNRHEGIGHDRCGCLQVSAEDVEPVVWQAVVDLLSNPDRLRVMAEQWLQVSLTGEESGADEDAIVRTQATIERLERARVRATKALLLADDPTPLEHALAEVQADLSTAQSRLETMLQFRSDAASRAQRLTDLAQLATRAAQRLPLMSPKQKAEVLALLDVRVTMDEIHRVKIPTSVGFSIKNEPGRLSIHGTLDARLFGDDSGSGATPEPSDPGGSDTGAGHSTGRSHGTEKTEDVGGRRVRGAAGAGAPQRRGAGDADRPRAPRAHPVRPRCAQRPGRRAGRAPAGCSAASGGVRAAASPSSSPLAW